MVKNGNVDNDALAVATNTAACVSAPAAHDDDVDDDGK